MVAEVDGSESCISDIDSEVGSCSNIMHPRLLTGLNTCIAEQDVIPGVCRMWSKQLQHWASLGAKTWSFAATLSR